MLSIPHPSTVHNLRQATLEDDLRSAPEDTGIGLSPLEDSIGTDTDTDS